ncbi:MAG: hypothetical protein DRJ03_04130 [Chloroflexi bacterium]|nr:MAG: hypothetical protein DRJ03_04130 [Chloroflexota bacterium]
MHELMIEFELKQKSLKQILDTLVEYLDLELKRGGITNYTISIPIDNDFIILHAQGYEAKQE